MSIVLGRNINIQIHCLDLCLLPFVIDRLEQTDRTTLSSQTSGIHALATETTAQL